MSLKGLLMLPQHSKASQEWYTPKWVVDAARECLGGRIGCDPATTESVNQVVGAETFFTAQTNGLSFARTWTPPVFLNPPGGLVKQFWARLMDEVVDAQRKGQEFKWVWVGFSLEQLASLQPLYGEYPHPLDFHTVILRRRIRFEQPGVVKSNPSHSNYISGGGMDQGTFARVWSSYGKVLSSGESQS